MRWAARHAVRGRGAGNRPAAHAVLVGWATDPRWWQYARLPLLGVLCAVAAALGLLAWRRRRQGRGAAAAPGLALVGYSAHRQPATEAPAQPRHEAPPDRCFAVLLQLMPILHEQPPRSLRGIAQPVSETLARELGVRVVLIGFLAPGSSWLRVVAMAGPGHAAAAGMRLSRREDLPDGRGAVGSALRSGQAEEWLLDEPRSAEREPWLRRMGAVGGLAIPAAGPDGMTLLLGVMFDAPSRPPRRAWPLLQHLIGLMARHLEVDASLARDARRERYRQAWLAMQQRLPGARSQREVLGVAADCLLEHTDVVAAEVFVPEPGGGMRRVHIPGRADEPGARTLTGGVARDTAAGQVHLLAWSSGRPQFVQRPTDDDSMASRWRDGPLANVGLVAGWPLAPAGATRRLGVARITVRDPQGPDALLHDLLLDMAGRIAKRLERVNGAEQALPRSPADALTGLPGRDALLRCLRQASGPSEPGCADLVLCLLDIDDFHAVNERWGRALGDSLLHAFGERLRVGMPQALCVARVGGDEFAVLLGCARGDASVALLAARMQDAMRTPAQPGFAQGDSRGELGFRMGVVRIADASASAEQWLRRAYAALRQAQCLRTAQGANWAMWDRRLDG